MRSIFMRRAAALLALFYIQLNGFAANAETFKGSILTRDSKTLVAPVFVLRNDGAARLTIKKTGQKIQVPYDTIARIVINRARTGQFSVSIEDAVLFLKDGRKFKISFSMKDFGSGEKFLGYKIVNPITGGLERLNIHGANISEIVFDADYGDLRQDEVGNLFPPDYVFSPYTGEEMKLVPVE